MPAKRKSGKWANDNKALRNNSKGLLDDTRSLLYWIAHPGCEPDTKRQNVENLIIEGTSGKEER